MMQSGFSSLNVALFQQTKDEPLKFGDKSKVVRLVLKFFVDPGVNLSLGLGNTPALCNVTD